MEAAISDVFTKGHGEVEAPMRFKSGEKLMMHFTGSRLVMNGKKYFVGVGTDITERKKVEEELVNARMTLEGAFEQTLVPMVLVSLPDAVLRIANTDSREILGIMDEPTPVGQQLMDFKPSYKDYDALGNLTPLAEAFLALVALKGTKNIKSRKKDCDERRICPLGFGQWESDLQLPR